MADIGSGLHKLMVITKGSQGAGEVSLKITSMQVWHNFSAQLADMVQAKAEQVAFSAIAGTNKDQNAVTENLKLAAGQSSPSGQYTIGGWKTDRPEIIAADGTVTRPAYDQGDQQVTLTPVFTAWDPENVEGDQKVKADGLPLVVTVKALGAEEGIEYVKKTLSFEDIKGGNAGASAVEQDLVLISEKLGVTLDWELVSITPPGTTAGIDLKTGGIIRPEQNQSDVVVTLRARLSCEGEETVSNPISFTVKKLAVPTAEYLKTVSEALTFEVIAGENKKPQEIRGDLSLPAQFQGAKVIWTSSDKAVAADGTVTREPYPGNPVPVTLTARLAYGAAELTKTFSLTVEPRAPRTWPKTAR